MREMLSKYFLHLTKKQRRGGDLWLLSGHIHKEAWAGWCYALADLFESIASAINGSDE